jgi:hypothetical protein
MIGNRVGVVIGQVLVVRLIGIDKQRAPVERGGRRGRIVSISVLIPAGLKAAGAGGRNTAPGQDESRPAR